MNIPVFLGLNQATKGAADSVAKGVASGGSDVVAYVPQLLCGPAILFSILALIGLSIYGLLDTYSGRYSNSKYIVKRIERVQKSMVFYGEWATVLFLIYVFVTSLILCLLAL